ncbi:CBS domain-containing protein (plasmid) [Caballeronia sp. NK8]|uniref:CBS domain-containing protein n=1 Tax=Caballeronia sp. NK8 TaxID=140098 RepID=UPI001BB566AB|nr:CBS domain-containing protein [Caballeronia sp. NK8]BCQ28950.1 CBS domain-containing protein [Caballeronia sp. NK8]
MRAADIMTTSVISVSPETAVRDAAKTMVLGNISGMPVINATGRLVGMVTEGDLLHRQEIGTGSKHRAWWLEMLSSTRELAGKYVKEHAGKVKDVMSTEVVTVNEDCTVSALAELLEGRRIKRVLVVRDGKVVGIISRANLLRAIVTLTPEQPAPVDHNDAWIRNEIVRAMKGERWAVAPENVIVKEGVVHLWGVVMSEKERQAARVAAENVEGVREVVSHLEFPVVMPAA